VDLHRGNLYLVGLPGAGKSTLGRQLARRLDKRFLDADRELERVLGVSIPTIFEIEGEASFRDREETMLKELATLTGIVLATVFHRVHMSRNRPLLNTPDKLARLEELYAVRDALYREVADVVLESDRGDIARFAAALEDARRNVRPA
jgi:shikimate kinase